MSKCNCDLCKRHRHADQLCNTGTREELAEFLSQTLNYLLEVESDLYYAEGIIDGSWHCADMIIERRRRMRMVRSVAEANGVKINRPSSPAEQSH